MEGMSHDAHGYPDDDLDSFSCYQRIVFHLQKSWGNLADGPVQDLMAALQAASFLLQRKAVKFLAQSLTKLSDATTLDESPLEPIVPSIKDSTASYEATVSNLSFIDDDVEVELGNDGPEMVDLCRKGS